MKNKKTKFYHGEKGAVLPIVLVALLLLNVIFLGTHRIYRNQMSNYYLLTFHYQSQTLLALTEKTLQEEFTGKTPPSKMTYNIGTVRIDQKAEGSLILTTVLPNGFTEQKEITVIKKETETEKEAEMESKVEVETEVKADTEIEVETNTEIEADTEVKTEPEAESAVDKISGE